MKVKRFITHTWPHEDMRAERGEAYYRHCYGDCRFLAVQKNLIFLTLPF